MYYDNLPPENERLLEQVCYFDCIDWVLTLSECAQMCRMSVEDVRLIAESAPDIYALEHDMICLAGRQSLCKQRQSRAPLQEVKWNIFKNQLNELPQIPFIEILFASGSFSLGNCKESSDLDVLIVTTPNRIATARLLLTLWTRYKKIKRINTHIQDAWCLNHYTTADAGLGPRNTYTGHLYSFLKPVFGRHETLYPFFASLWWVSEFVPCGPVFQHTPLLRTRVPSRLERMLSGRVGDWIESLLFFIQKCWFSVRRTNTEYEIFTKTELAFHPVPQEPEVLQKYTTLITTRSSTHKEA